MNVLIAEDDALTRLFLHRAVEHLSAYPNSDEMGHVSGSEPF
jgi:hypothetical protein